MRETSIFKRFLINAQTLCLELEAIDNICNFYDLYASTFHKHPLDGSFKKPKKCCKSRHLLGTADMIKDRMRKDFKLCLLKCFFLCSFSSFLIQGTCESHLVSIILSILPLKGKSLNFNLSVKDSLSTTVQRARLFTF